MSVANRRAVAHSAAYSVAQPPTSTQVRSPYCDIVLFSGFTLQFCWATISGMYPLVFPLILKNAVDPSRREDGGYVVLLMSILFVTALGFAARSGTHTYDLILHEAPYQSGIQR